MSQNPKDSARIRVSPRLWNSFPLILEALTVAGRKGITLRLFAFEEGKIPVARDQGTDGLLKLSDTGDLQVRVGKNWLLAREQPHWEQLLLDHESFRALCAFAEEREDQRGAYVAPAPPTPRSKYPKIILSDMFMVDEDTGVAVTVSMCGNRICELRFKSGRWQINHEEILCEAYGKWAQTTYGWELFGEMIRLVTEKYPRGEKK